MDAYKMLWAKKSDKDGSFKWLPLYIHSLDVMNIMGQLWNHWICEGQRDYITRGMGYYDSDCAQNIAMFVAYIHDIGKATPAFQTQKRGNRFLDLDLELLEKLEGVGFRDIKNLKLASPRLSHHTIAGEYILQLRGIKDDISSIVGGHHGRPVESSSMMKRQSAYQTNYYQTEDKNELYQKWHEIQTFFLQEGLKQCELNSVEELPNISQTAQILLSGLLIMADWIASNETYFPLIDISECSVSDYQKRLQEGWKRWFKNYPWNSTAHEYLNKEKGLFETRFQFSPKSFQEKISNEISKLEQPGLVIIEAPMGLGKTESALEAAEQLAEKTGRSGLLFGLPTQATSNGIFPRINSWLNSVAQDSEENLSIRLVHGKASLNEEFTDIPNSNNINIDESDEGSVFVNQWFSGRKTSALDDFVVATVDQLLMIALKQKHLALRHLGISKKVVVIDEVHAYDAYMGIFLFRAIEYLGAYHVPVVLLSATLPSEIRKDLVRYYMKGRGVKKRDIKHRLADLDTIAYPLLTMTDDIQIKSFTQFEKEGSKQIHINKLDEVHLIEKTKELYQKNGVVGIIVNTVKRAQQIARECVSIFGEEEVYLLHSNFMDSQRAEKERELMRLIGKNAPRNRKIIIGTQVLEQSLDIDFDVLITDLCPMDLLIQRMGRLQRHDRLDRESYFKNPTVYVLGMSEEFQFEKGSTAIYGDYLLIRTQHFLKEKIMIPDDISPLVQAVYREDDIDVVTENKERYEEEKYRYEKTLDDKKIKAEKNYLLSSPMLKIKDDNTLLGWLNVSANDSEETGYAQVRDTDETLEVIALMKNDINTKTSKELCKQTIRLNRDAVGYVNFDMVIEILEKYTKITFAKWEEDVWLKGKLGIQFDEKGRFELMIETNSKSMKPFKLCLMYDKKYGLMKNKEGQDEQI